MVHEVPLLLDRRRLGVALDDDQAAQIGAVLAGHLLPDRFALVVAEGDPAVAARARPGRPPSGTRASRRSRSSPTPPGRRRPPCAGRPAGPGTRPGPSCRHHSMNFGCHDSSARCSRRSPARSTLLGILASMSTVVSPWATPLRLVAVELRPRPGAEATQRALGADGVGPLEDPVLPRRETGEDLGLDRLRPGEAEARLHRR